MRGRPRVMILDDSGSHAEMIVGVLEKAGWTVTTVRIGDEAAMREALARGPWDLVISDWSTRPFATPQALEVLRETGHDLPFIIVSSTIGESGVVEGLRADAQVHLLKPEAAGFGAAIARVLRDAKSRGAQQRTETALHRTEEQLRQAQRAESVGNLAAGVAHHFNNVLSVILGHGDLILAELSPADPLYAAIEQMRSAGQSAADLTRQLLAFSQQQFLQPRVMDLNQILAGLERMVRKVVGEHIDLIILSGTDLGLVNVDPVQMEQVIMSLAINARDAMPDGGQLTLETANASLDASSSAHHPGTKPGPHVSLSFTDTGVGLTPEVRARIFEPYFMSKTPEWGTGLGLGTALGIVQQSGGSIFVTSEVGRGTTFKVCLPQADREDAVPRAPPRRQSADFRGNETILLVEDDERVRAVVRAMLRKMGYRVLEASNAGEGLLICEQRASSIDLLLTDVVMPRMSGRKLAERVAAIRAEIKVLYMSGYTDDFVFRQGVLDRGMAFLPKPIRPDMLARKVREVLDVGKVPPAS
ncbi:MAG TPA: response regulator [Polyangia bacterium]|jgi:two-component system cell cycle sensor histidine kinase/response regulator CckA|nr:response regulator [Polyangia bacterium]